MDKLWLFRLVLLADSVWKWTSETATSKEITVFVATDKIWVFSQKLEFWKICVCRGGLDSFLLLKDVSGWTQWLILTNVIFFFTLYI